MSPSGTEEIQPLPFRKVVQIAIRALRVRLWRSLLVVSGIVLAVMFLTYILCADGFLRYAIEFGSPELRNHLEREGLLNMDTLQDQRIQTWWQVGLALMISFVGIMNAMLMSVTERFREIGTMKCLGALDGFVLKLFLLESLFQGAVGTLVGILLGLTFGYAEGLSIYGAETFGLIPANVLITMLASCGAAGLVLTVLGALYPAHQAARMLPVAALRSEI